MKGSQPKEGQQNSVAFPSSIPISLAVLLGGMTLLERVKDNQRLEISFWAAATALLLLTLLAYRKAQASKRALTFQFAPRPVHYVQLTMQSCVYLYWGWYWPEVYHHAPLIVAQIVFAYALDMLVSWLRRGCWDLGFGPVPIILSTNLFMWFRDDWFYLQFLMIATGVLGKELVRWKRDGRYTHIFNPSAFGLFIFSIGLIVTHSTGITWGEEIATTLNRPPGIYLEIFLLGLIVQALFSVTLVTLSAAGMLYILNLLYTSSTGVYHFVDSNIPIAVFLGLHLLVTDPATSPRSTNGKIIFGGLYGGAVFGLYGALGWLGAPLFYDKLLCVPLLNLGVRRFDLAGRWLDAKFGSLFERLPGPLANLISTPRRVNFAFMGVWIALFATMSATSFVGGEHPGTSVAFWHEACEEGRWHACSTWVHTLKVSCTDGAADACFSLGHALDDGGLVNRDISEAGKGYGRACDLGVAQACEDLTKFAAGRDGEVFARDCDSGDGVSCFIWGSLLHLGKGVAKDDAAALAYFQKSCSDGCARGCGRLGESYLWGEGASPDPEKALLTFEKACRDQNAASCANAAIIYRRGIAGFVDEGLARRRMQQACELGIRPACRPPERTELLSPVNDRSRYGE